MQECFIFLFIVGYFEDDWENVFELFTFWGDEKYTRSPST